MRPNQIIDMLFAAKTDQVVISGVSSAIGESYGYENLNDTTTSGIPEDRRVIWYVESLTGFIGGEGIAGFWCQDCDHRYYAKALGLIGASSSSDAIIRSLDSLGPQSVPGREENIKKHFGSWQKAQEAAAEYLGLFGFDPTSIWNILAEYVRERKDSFEDIFPAVKKAIQH